MKALRRSELPPLLRAIHDPPKRIYLRGAGDPHAGRLRQAEQEAAAKQAEERLARIIDISERMRDEFYDQYADTERRAVGD